MNGPNERPPYRKTMDRAGTSELLDGLQEGFLLKKMKTRDVLKFFNYLVPLMTLPFSSFLGAVCEAVSVKARRKWP